ncbi:MAG: thiamine pyrophosphate-dependent enzyme, partial [Pseudomonadota bacterium]
AQNLGVGTIGGAERRAGIQNTGAGHYKAPPFKPTLNPQHIEQAGALIAKASRPLIMVGGGARHAAAEVLALARHLNAPVTSHRSGKGIVPADDPLALDLVAAYDYWEDCDLLIGIGSRLELQHMRWRWQPPHLKTIRIDIDPTEMVRLKPDCALVGDAADAAGALREAVRGSTANRTAALKTLKENARKKHETVQPQMAHWDAIRAALPRDGYVVEEVSQMGFTGRFGFPVYEPGHYVTCGYQDNLGFGYNTALGVKVANPTKAVVSVSGDGGFLFGLQELATAKQFSLGVIAIVFNNGAYGNVLRDQNTVYDGRVLGAELQNPDFVAVARAFGMTAQRVTTAKELQSTLERFIEADAPALIEVPVEQGSETSPWTFLHPAPYA